MKDHFPLILKVKFLGIIGNLMLTKKYISDWHFYQVESSQFIEQLLFDKSLLSGKGNVA